MIVLDIGKFLPKATSQQNSGCLGFLLLRFFFSLNKQTFPNRGKFLKPTCVPTSFFEVEICNGYHFDPVQRFLGHISTGGVEVAGGFTKGPN